MTSTQTSTQTFNTTLLTVILSAPLIRLPEPTQPSPRETADDLRACARYVRRGWTRGQLVDELGRVCAVGAMRLATGVPTNAISFLNSLGAQLRIDAMIHALAPLLPAATDLVSHRAQITPERRALLSAQHRITYFNDRICESAEELALLFIQAAEKLEAEL